LRLAPALVVLVIVASIFDMDGFRASAFWHVFQLSNIYFAATETVKPWVAGHLWSLNCLEQFYLVCPLVILLLPLQRVYVLAVAAWIAAVFIRTNGAHFGVNGWWTFFVLPFDSIAAGVLACLLMKHQKVAEVLASPAALACAAVVLFLPRFLWIGFGASESYRLLCEPALCVIVAGAFQGYRGPVGWLLGNRVARFLSQISYGVYMYHLMVWWLVVQVFPDLFDKGPRTFLVISLLTMLVATASWYLIEQPISKLKDRFPTGASAKRKAILAAS
jgi:peptidoglycan/LPS O-acetylase OafA/YrhL